MCKQQSPEVNDTWHKNIWVSSCVNNNNQRLTRSCVNKPVTSSVLTSTPGPKIETSHQSTLTLYTVLELVDVNGF